MSARLDIEYIEIRNFLSYGDYVTRLDVANLGPVLILGEVEAEDNTSSSNGAGKSSLLTAFIWCLFGRTITNPNPGDRVVNWYNGKNCYVKIKTADGWEIFRTRNFDGHSELILRKDGDDETRSTNTNAQVKLKELFGLDYEIFTSSVFCGQFGKSFLEMPPAKRKETVERLLGLDRLNKFADAAKTQFKQVEGRQEITRSKVDLVKADIDRQKERMQKTVNTSTEFEETRAEEIELYRGKAADTEAKIEELEVPDMEQLKQRWQLANAVLSKLSQYEDQIKENSFKAKSYLEQIQRFEESLNNDKFYEVPDLEKLKEQHRISNLARKKLETLGEDVLNLKGRMHCLGADIERFQSKIAAWEGLSDTSCELCEQEISAEHVKKNVHIVNKKLVSAITESNDLTTKHAKLTELTDTLKSVRPPSMSLEEAERLNGLNQKIAKNIKDDLERAEKTKIAHQEVLEQNESLTNTLETAMAQFEECKPNLTLEEASRLQYAKETLEKERDGFLNAMAYNSNKANPYGDIIKDLEETIKQLDEEITENEREIEQLDVLFTHYKYIYRSYSDRRKIKKWLLSELIPFLNDRVHYYLDMLDVDINIKFSSTLDAETDRWGYEFCSGGERKRIDLAIMFGLYDLYMSIYGQQCI